MIIDASRSAPAWVTIDPAQGKEKATRILFAPATRALRRRAFQAALARFPGLVLNEEDDSAERETLLAFSEEVGRQLVREAAQDWDGIVGPDRKAIPFSAEVLEVAMADEASGFFDMVDRAWLAMIRARDAEKNGSSALPAGTGKAGTRGKIIAGRAAASGKPASAATPAPTGPTNRKRTRAKGSGTS